MSIIIFIIPPNNCLRFQIINSTKICLSNYNIVENDDRKIWLTFLLNLSYPILKNLANENFKKRMNVEVSPDYRRTKEIAYTEALCRLLCGIAPWLELNDEGSDEYENLNKKELQNLAIISLKNAVNPNSPDYLVWYDNRLEQPLCESAYLAQAFIRAPKKLWYSLDKYTQQKYIEIFRKLRTVKGVLNNWVLFRAMIESFFLFIGEEYDKYVLNLAFYTMNKWYVGNGFYQDGDSFSFDYYNSFAIHPMLVESLEIMKNKKIHFSLSFDEA